MKKYLLLGFIAFSIISCGDDDPIPAKISLQSQISVDGDPFVIGQNYTINGDVVRFSNVKFYLGGFNASTSVGDVDLGTEKYILVEENTTTENNLMEISKPGTLTSFGFFVGVAPDINLQDEATFLNRPEEDPLSIQDVAMHWNWNTGYKFLRIDGLVDVDGDGTPETPTAYHLGSEAMRIGISYSPDRELTEGDNTLIFDLDLDLLFNNIDISENTETHTGDNLPLAERIRSNLPNSLRIGR